MGISQPKSFIETISGVYGNCASGKNGWKTDEELFWIQRPDCACERLRIQRLKQYTLIAGLNWFNRYCEQSDEQNRVGT